MSVQPKQTPMNSGQVSTLDVGNASTLSKTVGETMAQPYTPKARLGAKPKKPTGGKHAAR